MDVSYPQIEVAHTHGPLFVFGFVLVLVLYLLESSQIEVHLLQSLVDWLTIMTLVIITVVTFDQLSIISDVTEVLRNMAVIRNRIRL